MKCIATIIIKILRERHTMSNQNNTKRDPMGEVFSWILIIVCLSVAWPLGLFLIFKKLRGYAADSNRRQNEAPPVSSAPVSAAQTAAAPAAGSAKTAAPAKKARKTKSSSKGRSGGLPMVLLIIAIVLAAFGLNKIIPSLEYGLRYGMDRYEISNIIHGAFYLLGGAGTLGLRGAWKSRMRRQDKYLAIIGKRKSVSLSEIASAAGIRERKVSRDLHNMIHDGYFPQGAYIDEGLGCYVSSPSAAEELRREKEEAYAPPKKADPVTVENEHVRILNEMREQNAIIEDKAMSDKIDTLEDITTKIFMAVDNDPEKDKQLRKFKSYYLPTTMKLLRSYATLEKQGGSGGENVTAAKERIDGILDTLIVGYGQQLDRLYKHDMLDISADIDVLEDMMEQDGLTNESQPFRTMGGN